MTSAEASTEKPASPADRSSAAVKPVVLVTGAAGDIGGRLATALGDDYTVVGLDQEGKKANCELISVDLTSRDSIQLAMQTVRARHGIRIASVIHLAAYFDFTGEDNPLYASVNVEGTRGLLQALQDFEATQFIYASTMLVHRPGAPGLPINEQTEIDPRWAYPRSKAEAEDVVRCECGDIPYVILRLAGVYDEVSAVPSLADQIRRIYERDPESHAYSGSLRSGQAFLHKDDMVRAFRHTVERRDKLPAGISVLVGETDTVGYGDLQNEIAQLVHGASEWSTARLPKPVAKAGAWLQQTSEPVVPDAFDHGKKPFIRPFMVTMADDHYELDIHRARELLDWTPHKTLRRELPQLIDSLRKDPIAWYERNGLTPPYWMTAAETRREDPDDLRTRAEASYCEAHRRSLWAPLFSMALGLWLVVSPLTMGYSGTALAWSDVVSGAAISALAFLTLSWRFGLLRWAVALAGCWVMGAPLLFWAETAAGYLNGTVIGALVVGFAVLTGPTPGVSRIAAQTGPVIPPGWDYSPSAWTQRMPIIVLALVGLLISRYMASYQLGHVEGVWDPFFPGALGDDRNGTEEIITSSVSEAWPVPDAGVGAFTYMLEILTGVIGSSRRWRTMPWLVVLFGVMIVPLGVVSISFIIIQPIVLGTWCTLCLIAAAAMLIQIPYSIDELIATGQFLARRKRAGRPLLRVFLAGDTDEGATQKEPDEFAQSTGVFMRDMAGGGVGLPWSLGLSILIGVWLMFTRLTLGAEGVLADADHVVGALVLTVSVTALAEAARPVRFLNAALGTGIVIVALVAGATPLQAINDIVCGLVLVLLSIPRGKIAHRYGGWNAGLF